MSDFAIRAAEPHQWPEIVDLGAHCFPRDGDDWYVRHVWPRLPAEPGFDYDRVRLGMVHGRIVAHLMIVDRSVRLGGSTLRFGGIQGVCVHPDFRRHGYAAALMRDALDYLADRRVPMSLLYGIPRYYDRFGYATLFPSSLLYVTLEEIRRIALETDYRVRHATPADVPAMLALYEDEWAARPWSGQRTPDWLGWRVDLQRKDGGPYAVVVEDRAGAVHGYSCGWDPGDRQEVVVADCAAAAALLRHAADELGEPGDQTVRWVEPPDTRASRCLRELCTVQNQVWETCAGGWMGRLVDAEAALDRVRPEIVERVSARAVRAADAVRLEARGESVLLAVDGTHANIAQSTFLRLLFGFYWPGDVASMPGLSRPAQRLLTELFPHHVPQFAGLDWF